MKRIALAAAVALAGTGCIVVDDDDPGPSPVYGSVNLYWDFLRTAPAQPSGSLVYDESDVGTPDGACDESAVELVEVTSPLGTSTVPCVYAGVEGVGLDGIAQGTRSFRFRGWRGDFLVYDTTVNLGVAGNATTDHFVDVRGVSAPLDMFAYLAFGPSPGTLYGSCAAATPVGSSVPPNIGYEIKDAFGNLVDEGLVGCSNPLPATVFVGDLELDNFDVRMRGYRAEDDALVFDSCDVPLDHFVAQTAQDGLAPVLLTNPIPTCP